MADVFFKRDIYSLYNSNYKASSILPYIHGYKNLGRKSINNVIHKSVVCSVEERSMLYNSYINKELLEKTVSYVKMALLYGDFDVVRYIIDKYKNPELNVQILYDVCYVKCDQLAEYLLDIGTDPTDSFSLMCYNKMDRVVHRSVDYVPISRLDHAIIFAGGYGDRLVLSKLIERGANNYTGALIKAFMQGKNDVVEWLCSFDIDWKEVKKQAEEIYEVSSSEPGDQDGNDDPDMERSRQLIMFAQYNSFSNLTEMAHKIEE